jgi:hypothetical protein
MRAHPIGKVKKPRRFWTWTLALSLLSGMFAFTWLARPELRAVFAQSTTPPEASSQEQTTPAQGASSGKPISKEDIQALPAAESQPHRVADDSANLLKLANALKADVDKSTAETFSAAAIREVQEIEKLARKMRTK